MNSEPSAATVVSEMIGQFLSKIITGDSFRLEKVPPISPPEKFTVGVNYALLELQSKFHSARQNIGETVESYAYRVKQLVSKAFPEDTSEAKDRRAVERFVGVSGASVKKALITKLPKSLSEAFALAGETERLQ
ncbi:unnamed protein product [Echinostoma caproni]|uniref:Retrotrans_gag domain-containing protein n=1 Tax=Echinostoma caproni TaxID=27848 RepID=A0A183AVZ3_9TREM|nr:unnamed protein product [Echinostoma caproni]